MVTIFIVRLERNNSLIQLFVLRRDFRPFFQLILENFVIPSNESQNELFIILALLVLKICAFKVQK